jgi:uncharacterized protein
MNGSLDLLVVQPTPFCNLDCSYCYLPDRASTRRMSAETLEWTFRRVAESDLDTRRFTVVWHAGEPLVLPPSFYEDAFSVAVRFSKPGSAITHSFQTNATLVDDAFCALMRRHRVRVGISVDGPAFLNDRTRKTRGGKGTFEKVLAGIETLRRNDIPFHVITVLTRESLDYPDELYAFYREQDIVQVGFNVEEIEGPHVQSSLSADGTKVRYQAFMSRFFDLAMDGTPRLEVREFGSMMASLLYAGPERTVPAQEAAPFAILSVDCDGNFSTFSPELLGLKSSTYDGFVIGNVVRHTLAEAEMSPRYQRMSADIAAGVTKCREECAYFAFCGGGAPANKYFENGSFDSTETLFCRLHRQALAEVLISKVHSPNPLNVHAK